MIKRSVIETFGQEALIVYKRHQGDPRNIASKAAKQISKASVPTRHSYDWGTPFLGKDPERSRVSTSDPTSYDISLLGPGESTPSRTFDAAPVGLRTGEPVSLSLSHADEDTNIKKVRHSRLSCSAKSQATLERIRNPKARDSHIVKDDSQCSPLGPSYRLNKFERAAFIDGPTVQEKHAEIKDGNDKICKTSKIESLVGPSAPAAIPRILERVSSDSRAVDHVPSRCNKIEGSHLLSPELESSTPSKRPNISDGNDSEYKGSQRQVCEKVFATDLGGQPRRLKQPSDLIMTKSRRASNYSRPSLSPVSLERELMENLDFSQSTRQRLSTSHVGTPLELINAGENQAGDAMEDALEVNEYAIIENTDNSNRSREKDVVHQIDRRQLLDSKDLYRDDGEEDAVGLRTDVNPRTTSVRGQARRSRTTTDESNREAEQPPHIDNSYRLKTYLARLDTDHVPQRFHRRINCSADSLRLQAFSRTRSTPLTSGDQLLNASTNARSSQNLRQGG